MSEPDYTITELNLCCKGLNKLPDDIHKYTNIVELNSSDNNINSLDNLPPKMEKLK